MTFSYKNIASFLAGIKFNNYLYYCNKEKQLKDKIMKTYDLHFNDSTDSNNKGFKLTINECRDYIGMYNGTNDSYFADYKGGAVSIVCNETGEEVYSELIK